MKDRRRQIVLAATAGALALIAVRHPTADFRIETHDVRDLTPHKVQAAIDFGLVGVSVLYTWTSRSIAH